MPKRIVDGDGIWKSGKIKACEPLFQAEYANLIPLALSNGVFEVDVERIWAQIYSYNRPYVSTEFVKQMLQEFNRCGLLFLWEEQNKIWGYWVGIDKPGRLPGESRRGINEAKGPEVPKEKLSSYIRWFSEHSGTRGFIYFIQGEKTKLIKIGKTEYPYERLRLFQTGSPDRLILIGVIPYVSNGITEGDVHKKFEPYRVYGEWFKADKEVLDFIKEKSTDLEKARIPMESNGIQKLPGLGFGLGIGKGLGEETTVISAAGQEDETMNRKKVREILATELNFFGPVYDDQMETLGLLEKKWPKIVLADLRDWAREGGWDSNRTPYPLNDYLIVAGERLENFQPTTPVEKITPEDLKVHEQHMAEVQKKIDEGKKARETEDRAIDAARKNPMTPFGG